MLTLGTHSYCFRPLAVSSEIVTIGKRITYRRCRIDVQFYYYLFLPILMDGKHIQLVNTNHRRTSGGEEGQNI